MVGGVRVCNRAFGNHICGAGGRTAFRVQFGDVSFYNFLWDIGLFPCKSKILGFIAIPDDFSLIFFGDAMMATGLFIRIGIHAGVQAICSI